jgi:hypothetical protein
MKKKYKKPLLKKYNSLREITLCTCGVPDYYCTCVEYGPEAPDPPGSGGCECLYGQGWTCD